MRKRKLQKWAKMKCNNREYKPLKLPLGLTLLAIRFAFMTPSSMNYLQWLLSMVHACFHFNIIRRDRKFNIWPLVWFHLIPYYPRFQFLSKKMLRIIKNYLSCDMNMLLPLSIILIYFYSLFAILLIFPSTRNNAHTLEDFFHPS